MDWIMLLLWYQFEQIVQCINGIWKEIGCYIIIVQAQALQFGETLIAEARNLQSVVCLIEGIVTIGITDAFPKHFGQLLIRQLHRMNLFGMLTYSVMNWKLFVQKVHSFYNAYIHSLAAICKLLRAVLTFVWIIRVLILMLTQTRPWRGLKAAIVTAPNLWLLMIALLVLAQQCVILKLTIAATTTDHLQLLHMGALVVHTQLGGIDVV